MWAGVAAEDFLDDAERGVDGVGGLAEDGELGDGGGVGLGGGAAVRGTAVDGGGGSGAGGGWGGGELREGLFEERGKLVGGGNTDAVVGVEGGDPVVGGDVDAAVAKRGRGGGRRCRGRGSGGRGAVAVAVIVVGGGVAGGGVGVPRPPATVETELTTALEALLETESSALLHGVGDETLLAETTGGGPGAGSIGLCLVGLGLESGEDVLGAGDLVLGGGELGLVEPELVVGVGCVGEGGETGGVEGVHVGAGVVQGALSSVGAVSLDGELVGAGHHHVRLVVAGDDPRTRQVHPQARARSAAVDILSSLEAVASAARRARRRRPHAQKGAFYSPAHRHRLPDILTQPAVDADAQGREAGHRGPRG